MLDLSRRYPDTNAGLGVNVKPLHDQITGSVRSLLQLLQLAVGMMLLIACANVAHLLLGQAAGRSGEMTTRAALGAGRGRLVRQMLAETLVLAVPGGLLGLAIAAGSVNALLAAAPDGLPRVSEIRLDPIVLGFTVARHRDHRDRFRSRTSDPTGAAGHAVAGALNSPTRRQPAGPPLASRHRRHRARSGADAARRRRTPACEFSGEPARAARLLD